MENNNNNNNKKSNENGKKAEDWDLFEDATTRRTNQVHARIRKAQAEAAQAAAQLKAQGVHQKTPSLNPKTKASRRKKKSSPSPAPSPARSPDQNQHIPIRGPVKSKDDNGPKAIGSNEKINMKIKRASKSIDEDENDMVYRHAVWSKFIEQCVCIETAVTINSYYLSHLLNLCPSSKSYDAFNRNQAKNRNPDVFCTDKTRVRLSDPHDYIHANVIRFEKLPKKTYIATQHPMESTILDFWTMIAETKADVIISLTNAATSPDFPLYYPNKPETFRNIGKHFLYCKRVQTPKDRNEYTEYSFEFVVSGETTRRVTLYHYPHWNKNQVPSSTRVVLYAVKVLARRRSTAPIVVQCETGVNQSAEVILVDAFCNYLLYAIEPHFENVFRQLRFQRASTMTQRIHFLHSIACVLDFIKANRKNLPPTELTNIESVMSAITKDFAKNMSVEPPIEEAVVQ